MLPSRSFPYRFSVYALPLADDDGHETIKRMIVLKNRLGFVIFFTGYEYFSYPYTGKRPAIRERNHQELHYVCHALNYILIENYKKYKIERLSEVTADMLFDAFDAYRDTPKSLGTAQYRSQQSLSKYVYAVSSFFANVSLLCSNCAVSPDDLLYEKTLPGRSGATKQRRVVYLPFYQKKSKSVEVSSLMRDIPEKVLGMLVEAAEIHDPMLVFPIIAAKTSGLRLGELMNMRQKDSPLSGTPGIRFSYQGTAVTNVEIDMTREYRMRSDGVNCGKIKKERIVKLYKPFIPEFMRGYMYHMKLLERIPCEAAYKPMFIGRNGKALTDKAFSARFTNLVNTHLKPRLLASEDPALVAYGLELDTLSLTPHALRHYFSVRLVLENMDSAEIMFYRGDKSPSSALTYLANKGTLLKRLQETHTAVLDMLRIESRV